MSPKEASENYVGLNFKVSPEFRKEFRLFAAKKDISLVELLKEAFDLYQI